MPVVGLPPVLVIDDDPSVRSYLEQALKTSGYEPAVASSGQEALRRASERRFEVALLDIRLPDQSGLDVLRQLHKEYPDSAVIMITAFAEVETAVEAMKNGAYDYAVKPFKLDDLLLRVERARERSQMALQLKEYQKNLEARVAEQAKEIRDMTAQAVRALFQEEILRRELEEKRGRAKPLTTRDLKDIGTKIMKALRGQAA